MTGSQARKSELSLEELDAYEKRRAVPSKRVQNWSARCCAYYGAASVDLVAQWQRDAYVRLTGDKEPRS